MSNVQQNETITGPWQLAKQTSISWDRTQELLFGVSDGAHHPGRSIKATLKSKCSKLPCHSSCRRETCSELGRNDSWGSTAHSTYAIWIDDDQVDKLLYNGSSLLSLVHQYINFEPVNTVRRATQKDFGNEGP